MKTITFTLDNKKVIARENETIWQVAKREGIDIPHMCWQPKPGYAASGNCRTCMVEIKNERVLSASCVRTPTEGMEVHTTSRRAEKARKAVFELLGSDQPEKSVAHDKDSKFWQWADKLDIKVDRFARKKSFNDFCTPDASHPAIRVNLDACINCNLCVRACRDVQVNDVIGVSGRGSSAHIAFDIDDLMGDSTCVGCGECVQACPTGALMPATQVDELQHFVGAAEKVVKSSCPFCGVGCLTNIHVKENKILKVDGRNGPANENRMCVKGRFGLNYASHENRLKTPLIRRDDAPSKTWDMYIPDSDYSQYFREATWQEAMEKAAQGFLKIKGETGGDSLVGFGSAKGSNEEAYLFQKLVRTGFGTNNVDHCTRLCHASSVAALLESLSSGAVSNPFTDVKEAECAIIIGARPSWNHPVAATFIKQAAKKGTKLIIMDPRSQDLVRYAYKHLQFKAGTDVAMLKAIIKIIIDNGWVDKDFIKNRVSGYEEIVESTKHYTVEDMSKICGISVEDLYDTAKTYAHSKASMIMWGMGVSQHIHGTDNNRCLITIAMITGNIGRPGTGLHPLRGQNNVQGASDVGLIPMMYPDYMRVDNPQFQEKFEKAWKTNLSSKVGLTVVEVVDAILKEEVRGVYIMGENPAMSDPDTQHTRKALAKLEHLVVQEIFMTETAMFADIILPASAFPEKLGTFSNTNRQVQMVRPALDTPGKARQDLDIIMDLASRIGLNWNYNGAKDVFAEMTSVMPSIAGMTWERLDKEDSITYPCTTKDDAGQANIFIDTFPTKSGRAKLVATEIIAPAEVPDEKYPFILTTGRLLEHWHTGAMTRRATVLDAIEPEAVVHIHPRSMVDLDLKAGEYANIRTRRGDLYLKVRVDREVPMGMVFIPFCFAEAPANILTNPKLDPFGKIPEFKFCAARVERAAP